MRTPFTRPTRSARVLAVSMVSVYVLFSVGVLKATHFCMGREASVALFTVEAEKCPCSVYAGEADSCCDDKHELIKLDNEQKLFTSWLMPAASRFVLHEVYTFLAVDEPEEFKAALSTDHPLPPPKVPRWKRLCNLVYYG